MLEVTFRLPEAGDEAAVVEAQRVMALEHFVFAFGYEPGQDFSEWVARTEAQRLGRNLAPGRVAGTFELAFVGEQLAGRLSVRHALNDFLLQQGGHIGYGVLPPFRRQRLGTRMLQRGLEHAATLGIGRVLVTCDETNVASRRIIEGAAGVYESSYSGPDVRIPIRRYWFG
jgi:predicted acetyltransferase